MTVCLKIPSIEFELMCRLKIKHRADWPACFSSNPEGKIWIFVTHGKTPEEKKIYVQERSQILARVADALSKTKDSRGRFFINDKGAFWKDAALKLHQFVEWEADTRELRAILSKLENEEQARVCQLDGVEIDTWSSLLAKKRAANIGKKT
ncbi:MAG TPA: hypothetical protein VL346_11245 [Acidobacteriaceae bacterium]|nr:hypothetical protein [Acidobacteriaceae bacterium]